MKGKIGILFCCIFFLLGELAAQKTRKYTTNLDKRHTTFDSILKQSFKNKILIASLCDTSKLIDEMSSYIKSIEESGNDPIQLICDLGNVYHTWIILKLCRNQSLIRAGNDKQFYLTDTIIIDRIPYTLHSLRESIIELGRKAHLLCPFILWDGTKSGAYPPKKAWTKKSVKSLIQSSGKAYFKNAEDEFTADISVHTLCISEKLIKEIHTSSSTDEIDINTTLKILSPYLPDYVSAYCVLNKSTIKLRAIPVSDILSRIP